MKKLFIEEFIRSQEYEKQGYRIVDCPICGRKTLDMHWICRECFWEYDGTEEDEHSSANGKTPRNYRKDYKSGMLSNDPKDKAN